MLIFSRKLGQAVHIGDGIVIRIVEVRRSRIRIGIEAPPEVRIQRSEHICRTISYDGEEPLLFDRGQFAMVGLSLYDNPRVIDADPIVGGGILRSNLVHHITAG